CRDGGSHFQVRLARAPRCGAVPGYAGGGLAIVRAAGLRRCRHAGDRGIGRGRRPPLLRLGRRVDLSGPAGRGRCRGVANPCGAQTRGGSCHADARPALAARGSRCLPAPGVGAGGACQAGEGELRSGGPPQSRPHVSGDLSGLMQTNFTLAQLADADVAESEKILRTCVHCGFCLATCPTYLLTGDELDGPRGRIYLVKDMLESGAPASATVARHIDRCLSCLSCMTTCPSGVNYMHLVDHARRHIQETFVRPLPDRLLRRMLAAVLPFPGRFRLSLRLAQLARPFAALLPGRLKTLIALAPLHVPNASTVDRPQIFPAEGKRRARVALLSGCAQQVLKPEINAATIRLLTRHGVEVVVSNGMGCCGSLTHHLGQEGSALAFARANIDAWCREIDGAGLDAIIANASGCGTTLKDYGFMLRQDPAWAAKAAKVSALARDVTEVMAEIGLAPSKTGSMRVAYHSAC